MKQGFFFGVKKQHGEVTKNCSSTFVTLTNFGLAHWIESVFCHSKNWGQISKPTHSDWNRLKHLNSTNLGNGSPKIEEQIPPQNSLRWFNCFDSDQTSLFQDLQPQSGKLQSQSPKANSMKLFLPMIHSSFEQQFPPNASQSLHLSMAHNWSVGRGMHLAFTSQWWTWSRHFGKPLGATCHRQHMLFLWSDEVWNQGLDDYIDGLHQTALGGKLQWDFSSRRKCIFWIVLGGCCSKSLGHKWTYRYLRAWIWPILSSRTCTLILSRAIARKVVESLPRWHSWSINWQRQAKFDVSRLVMILDPLETHPMTTPIPIFFGGWRNIVRTWIEKKEQDRCRYLDVSNFGTS